MTTFTETEKTYPKTASKFLRWAMIQEAAGDHGDAGWAAVQAAWVCDDDDEANSKAKTSRQRAVGLFEQARRNGIGFAESSGAEDAIMADLLIRSGDFEKVEALCNQSLNKEQEEFVEQILKFQLYLSRNKDAKCYTIEEVEDFGAA